MGLFPVLGDKNVRSAPGKKTALKQIAVFPLNGIRAATKMHVTDHAPSSVCNDEQTEMRSSNHWVHSEQWWAVLGSNQWPLRCQRGGL